jgi:hypothetical protein
MSVEVSQADAILGDCDHYLKNGKKWMKSVTNHIKTLKKMRNKTRRQFKSMYDEAKMKD